jgi:T3SS (YopN, CesT) and YbjN peptide-binding chaperone 1
MGMQIEWLAAYVEKCLRESWGDDADHLISSDHMVTFRAGTAACQVRVEDGDPTMVRVMALAVTDVNSSAKLLREVNEVNAHARVANVWWAARDVVVECSLFAESVTVDTLEQACQHVVNVANDIGVGMAAMYDGTTPYPPLASDSEEAA